MDLYKIDGLGDKLADASDLLNKYGLTDYILFYCSIQKEGKDIAEPTYVVSSGMKLGLGMVSPYRMMSVDGRGTKNHGILRVLNFAVVSGGNINRVAIQGMANMFSARLKVRKLC